MKKDLIEQVANILREVAAGIIMPHFELGRSVPGWEKSRGEIVTAVDQAAEQAISERLVELAPGSLVIGEEACAADPRLLGSLAEPDVWLLDPLDGTRNFAGGQEPFAVMLARLRHGRPVASWILDPVRGRLLLAEAGSGAWNGEERLRCHPSAGTIDDASAIVSNAFTPSDQQTWSDDLSARLGAVRPTRRCAGDEYPLIATGQLDLILYWRTLPWDHVPGTLLVSEAGGAVRQVDGTAYDPSQAKPGLMAAASEDLLAQALRS